MLVEFSRQDCHVCKCVHLNWGTVKLMGVPIIAPYLHGYCAGTVRSIVLFLIQLHRIGFRLKVESLVLAKQTSGCRFVAQKRQWLFQKLLSLSSKNGF